MKSYVKIIGDNYDVQEITDALNIEPHRTRVKGDLIRNTGKRYKYTTWIYGTDTIESFFIDELAEKIQKLFMPKADKIIELKEKYDLGIAIEFVIIIENKEPPSICFTPEFLAFAAKIGASFDLDMYVH